MADRSIREALIEAAPTLYALIGGDGIDGWVDGREVKRLINNKLSAAGVDIISPGSEIMSSLRKAESDLLSINL